MHKIIVDGDTVFTSNSQLETIPNLNGWRIQALTKLQWFRRSQSPWLKKFQPSFKGKNDDPADLGSEYANTQLMTRHKLYDMKPFRSAQLFLNSNTNCGWEKSKTKRKNTLIDTVDKWHYETHLKIVHLSKTICFWTKCSLDNLNTSSSGEKAQTKNHEWCKCILQRKKHCSVLFHVATKMRLHDM